jgi:hypothetical protein
MPRALYCLFFCIAPLIVFGQQEFRGKVLFEGKPLDLASISIRNDQQGVALLVSDGNGTFSTSLANGTYHLEVSLLGYKTYRKDFTVPGSELLVELEKDEKMLGTFTVQGTKPLVERKLDRIIFNVQNSIIASGGTVWDAVGRAPGVRTTFDGGISAIGKNVVIYMDNRILRMSGEELAAFLRSLNAANILRIEVILNPPASYDAQGGAVINIVSKKILATGLNATVNGGYTQATYGSFRGGVNFNYRSEKINVFGSVSASDTKKDYWETDYIFYQSTANDAYWEGLKRGTRAGNTLTYKLGVDYTLAKNHVIGVIIDGTNSRRKRQTDIHTNIYNHHSPIIDSFLVTNNRMDARVNQYAFNFNYKGMLDTSGRKSVNIDIDYAPFRNNRDQYALFSAYNRDEAKLPTGFSNNNLGVQDVKILSGKLDYVQKFDKDWTLETGTKLSRIVNNSVQDFYNLGNGSPVFDSSQSNRFRYTEKILALYVNTQGAIGKLSFELGLRGEYTWTTGYSETLHQTTLNKYMQFFPTFFTVYSLNDDHEVNAYYGRRINRPDYWRLNPFKYYTSPYSYMEGNPALRPAFVNEVELGYSFKKQYSINFFYRHTKNFFSNITIQDNERNLFYDTQRNLDQSLETGAYVSLPFKPFPWWEMNYFIQASYKNERSGFLNSNYNYNTWFMYTSLTQAFIISKKNGWRAEINSWYASPGIQGIYRIGSNYDLSFGVRKTLWKDKASLQLSVADIFYSNYYRIDVKFENQRNGFKEKTDTRSLTLNFSYKLGKKKIEAARKRKTSNEEERKRALN